MKVRRRAFEAKAIQWDGNNVEAVISFLSRIAAVCIPWSDNTLSIRTAESTQLVRQGQWLILDERDTLHVHAPSTFREAYEEVLCS